MKTRITVLNSRANARYPWPEPSIMYNPETGGQCCIGQQGRQNAGMDPEDLRVNYPAFVHVPNHDSRWVKAWSQDVPDSVVEEIGESVGRRIIPSMAKAIASHLNDKVAVREKDPAKAVAGLRILWRWLGETQGERWIIRWLRPGGEGDS